MTTEALPPLEGRLLDPMQDHFGLIELSETVFGRAVTPAAWYWKNMPKWTQRHYCYVGRVEGKVIGYFGAVPLRGWLEGEEVAFFQLADFMVHPKFRLKYDYFNIGCVTILKDIKESHDRHLVYGFSGHAAFRYLVKRKIGGFVEKAQTRYKRLVDVPRSTRFEFVDWKWNAPQLDALWETSKVNIRAGLIRDGDYLTWRYGTHPINNYRLLGVRERGEDLGFIVMGNDRPGVRDRAEEIPIVDALLPDGMAADIVQEFTGFVENDVMIWLPDHRSAGFTEQVDSGTHCYHFLKDSAASTDFLRDHLYYTMGDVDWW